MPIVGGIGQSNCGSYAQGTPPVAFASYAAGALVWNSRTLEPSEGYSITDYGTAFVHPSDLGRPANSSPGLIALIPALIHKAVTLDARGRGWSGIASSRGGKAFETDWWNASGRQGACLRFENVLIAAGIGSTLPALAVLYSQGWELSCNAATSDADRNNFRTWHKAMVAHLVAVGRLASDAAIVITGVHPSSPGSGDKVAWNAMLADLAADYVALGFNAAFVAVPSTIVLAPTGGPHWDAAGQWLMAAMVWTRLVSLGV